MLLVQESHILSYFLGIYPKKSKTLIQKNISTPMFIAALFTVTETWNQPKCLSVDEWIKQLWDTYRMEYYSAMKIEENLILFESMGVPRKHYAK